MSMSKALYRHMKCPRLTSSGNRPRSSGPRWIKRVRSGAARRKLTPARSGKTAAGSMPSARAAATAAKTKKRGKH